MRILVLCQLNWVGPARFPAALKRAGCSVGMVCRRDHLAAKTKHVDQHFFCQPVDQAGWLRDIVRAIEVFQPDHIVPGSELSVQAMLEIWELSKAGASGLSSECLQAIRRSLFDPSKRGLFDSKIDLVFALESAGIRIPETTEIHTLSDAESFIARHGYPIILKPSSGSGGNGIAICNDEETLLEELRKRLSGGQGKRWMMQKYLEADTAMYQMFCLDGDVVCGYSLRRLMTHPFPTGPSSVVQIFENEEMADTARKFANLMGYNGIGSLQFLIDPKTNRSYFMEANMRLGVSMHLGDRFGTDLALALVKGREYIAPPLNNGITVALYPQEVIRDPESPYLSAWVDKPEDDPDLLEALQGRIRRVHSHS